ncbi:MAG TPA: hypothetical protein PKJ43_03770 [Prolixibacteraceae bacterium]|nr:hypothetical protein [Bacteroidales bacterium]HNZ71711.1 hypothetical protein [Prolixibacteraceae bacterium]HQN94402.1 hypothetical protein [Prolixibacteraceae bacterium]
MNREGLIESAGKLISFDSAAVLEYEKKLPIMVQLMNEKMEARNDISDLVGDNVLMMRDNHANHARFILSVMQNFNAEVLVDTILWVFRAYRSRNFHSSYWAAQLNTWLLVFESELSPSAYREIWRIYNWMQVNIPSFVICSDDKLSENKSKHISD